MNAPPALPTERYARTAEVIGSQLTAFSSARQGVRIWLRFPRVKSRNIARIRLNLNAFLPLHSTNDFIKFRFVRRFRARRCQVVEIVSDSAHAHRVPVSQRSIQKFTSSNWLGSPASARGLSRRRRGPYSRPTRSNRPGQPKHRDPSRDAVRAVGVRGVQKLK
jgi:hypothetical protein